MRIILSSICVVVGRQISTRRRPAYSDAAMRDAQKKKAPCKKHDALVFHVVCDQLVDGIADDSQPLPDCHVD
ncbi:MULTISPECIES: hypothetical protein [unclassified Bradyrhizobium]|uniref:hypothetical protein n=1 Tax=unclassified Bradyrhizobium TaxID=2631580 RepID=UPI001FFB7663|nr:MULTISPECIES: hypothetical protein [unclassified Bradyrhizobium]MCK1524476.1 hypothetical protein [Bradyrhizobium sp. 17]MCK1691265.1 hypothetical protein [Bradyrhizobium sp. 145]